MTADPQILGLASLARTGGSPDRERLLMAVVDMCEGAQAGNPGGIAASQPLLGDLFLKLAARAERDVRRRLAERIADAEWAPPALVNMLVLDEIEIARPIISASPLLADQDLLAILAQATLEHQIEVARRPGIGAPVVNAILDARQPVVMTALAGNEAVLMPPQAMDRLIEESRKVPSLRSPLARHPQLSPQMAERLYTWVGESLKAAIVSRFRIDVAALDSAIADTVRDLAGPAPAPLPAAPTPRAQDREAMERRLVEKLYEAGQLRSGYLLRALREHRLSLFEAALAKLGGLTPGEVRRTLSGDQPEMLALACLAAGIDRSVFPTLLGLIRQLNEGRPSGSPESMQRASDMFNANTPETASTVLREALCA